MADKRDVRSALRAYEQPSMLQGAWDEIAGAFARYGRRSGAQRDASLAMLNQAVDPNTDPLTGAAQKVLGLAGLVTHPLALFPTGDEWRERTRNAGNTGRMGQAIGGMLGDLPSIVDPHLLAGGGALAMAPLATKMMNKADDAADAGIIAYHGSPHSFDKFDMSKIGTGEGAQAYGHGLYFAEAEDVAKTYRDQITKQATGKDQVLERATRYLNQNGGDYEAAYNDLLPQRNSAAKSLEAQKAKGRDTAYMESDLANYDAALSALKSKAPVNGSMYQVKINVKPEELLDWDKPLSEHPAPIRNALMSLMDSEKAAKIQAGKTRLDTGADAYKAIPRVNYAVNKSGQFEASAAKTKQEALAEAGGDASKVREIRTQDAGHATEILKQNGVKGIRYKDAGSRGADGGTYNYVVFDDKLITILKKYGIPMTAGAGGAMLVAGQDMPPDIASQMGGT